MSNILETIMLICFGCSWPISLVNNYKAGTAKGTSLYFVLLIMLGYICGIAAKIIAGNVNYVLIIYLINLVVVSLNLLVYFRNRNLDIRGAKDVQA